MHASLRLDPLHSYEFSGVPWLANWTVSLDASIELAINVDRVTDFRLFNKTLGITTEMDNTNHDATGFLGPINMVPEYIYAGVTFLGVTLFGFELPPFNAGLPLPFEFPSCDGDDLAAGIVGGDVFGGSAVRNFLDTLPWNLTTDFEEEGYGIALGAENDTLVFPALHPPGFPGGGLETLGVGVLADLMPGVAHGIGCAIFNADPIDLITDEHPGVPSVAAPSHPVPGEQSGTGHTPPDMDLPPDANDDVIFGDDSTEAEMCGLYAHDEITVVGNIKVADAPGPMCDAADVGYLQLAGTTVTIDGTIDADAVVKLNCNGTAESGYSTYDFERDGAVLPIVAYALGSGVLNPPDTCAHYQDFGTGAGHGGHGGSAAGRFGFAYDTRPVAGLATAGFAGGDGSTPFGGGEGGGHVKLTAAEVVVNGTITADGEDGASASSTCAALTRGSGGGSGGGITIVANRVTFGGGALLSADGGDGGSGSLWGAGGGALGDVEVQAGIISPAPPLSLNLGGPGSVSGGCAGLAGSAPIPAYLGHDAEGQQSAALPVGPGPSGDVWHSTNDVDFDRDGTIELEESEILVPIMASAGDPNSPNTGTSDNGMTIALCGVAISPATPEPERVFRLLTPDYASPTDPCGLADIAGIARVNTARLIDHQYLPDQYHIDAFTGFTLSIEDLVDNPDWCPVFPFLTQAEKDHLCGTEPVSAYYGLYTVVIRSDTPGNDCLAFDDLNGLLQDLQDCFDADELAGNNPDNECDDPSDYPVPDGFVQLLGFDALNVAYDNEHCYYPNIEVPPGDAGPDVIIAIDNDRPTVDSVTPVWEDVDAQNDTALGIAWTNHHVIAGNIETTDRLGTTAVVDESGVRAIECYERLPDNSTRFVYCSPQGFFLANLSGGDGRKNLFIRAYDAVGNPSEEFLYDDVVVDTVAPASSLAADPDPGPLPNGWYDENAPTLTISGFPDPDPSSLEAGPHPTGRYRYQIDDGTEWQCQVGQGPGDESCVIPDPIGPGLHRVWFTAVDRAGNRGVRAEDPDDDVCQAPPSSTTVMGCREFGMDFQDPIVEAFGAPDAFDGENGWWVTDPFVAVTVFDLPVGGSGVDAGVAPSVFEIETELLGQAPSGFATYDGPQLLGDGIWTVRARARDVAGNPNSTPPQNPPPNPPPVMTERQFRIDTTPPALALAAVGPVGSGGWFTGPTTVTPSASDTGSGMLPLAPSGVFVSVDGAMFLPTGPVVIGEGEHVVRAYAVDVAGNRSAVVERIVLVDRSRPVSALRTSPPAPAQNGWYRSTPTITLKATDGDENAGVQSLVWCLGTGCTPSTTYAAPFTVPAGTTVVRWRALDVSGAANHEAIRQVTVKADTAPPTAKATLPSPIIWSRTLANLGLGPTAVTLKWTVGDDRSGPLKVQVVVFDTFGTAVRRLDAGTVVAPPGGTVNGQTMWNGKNDTLSALVPLGVYHYRVVVTDEAGNVAESGESRLITIKLL